MLRFLYMSRFLKCLIIFSIFGEIKGEYYSSIVGLEKLLELENNYIKAVEHYIDNVEKVQENIESFLDEMDSEHQKIGQSKSFYFGDPINAFSVIKRLVLDWKYYDELIQMNLEYADLNYTISYHQNNVALPTVKDVQGAARGLSLLQRIYKLETHDLATGYILDEKISEDLKAHDCFIMGVSLYNSTEYLPASEWLMQALSLLTNSIYSEDEESFPLVTHIEILEYLHVSLFYGGHHKLAALMNQMLLKFDPENQIALNNKKLFAEAVVAERRLRYVNNSTKESQLNTLYAQVCSGELTQTEAEMRDLRCRYFTNNIAYYLIGPLKMEELNHDPFVAFYHQTIYESEIKEIKNLVRNNVVRSKIGNFVLSDIRTSKQSWLQWGEHKFMDKIAQRLEDITGLSIVNGESLQVVNYGIGGHYAPHYDFWEMPEVQYGRKSNRILTALFYINDVELGGSTAFPFLHLAVPPVKYSLLVWYNLHNTTEFDYRTKHAGCPVLKGSKWICNEWFTDIGQEFKRPCGLHSMADKYKHFYYMQ
ncbi:prolyl-4-hydroxylase-alpha SG1 [Cochliomyia hominivorax]